MRKHHAAKKRESSDTRMLLRLPSQAKLPNKAPEPNAGICPAACYRRRNRNETPDSESSCRTRRAGHGRGSSLTLGRKCDVESITPQKAHLGQPFLRILDTVRLIFTMPKTRRALYFAIAEKIGGTRGERLRAAVESAAPTDPLLEQVVSDERFEAEMKKLDQMPESRRPGFALPDDSWGLSN